MSEAELVSRLERLERDNRRLRRFVFAAAVLVAALAAIYATQPVPQVVRAHSFEVIDNSGKVRAKMAVQPNGESFIQVNNEQEHPRAALVASASGVTTIGIFDAQGQAVASLGTDAVSGSGIISANDAGGHTRVALIAEDSHGGCDLWLLGANGNKRADLTVSSSGSPAIILSDTHGFRMDLGSTSTVTPATGETQQTSAASIVMFGNDKGHLIIWRAP